MKTKTYAFIAFLSIFLARLPSHAGEQDNWYLAHDWSVGQTDSHGLAYRKDPVTGSELIYVTVDGSVDRIKVYDINGTLLLTSEYTGNAVRDVVVDSNGTFYSCSEKSVRAFGPNGNTLWILGKNNGGSSGSGDGEFSWPYGITLSSNGQIYVADRNNNRIQIIDKNGTYVSKFGKNGTAPGEFKKPHDLEFLHNGDLLIGDESFLNFFRADGTFLKRTNISSAKYYLSTAKDGTIFNYGKLRNINGEVLSGTPIGNARTCFTDDGDLIENNSGKIKVWKRAYRTKGLPVRNVIPQPAIRAISQRAGTNIIDLDFEIVDSDDTNSTIGILAAVDGDFSDASKLILPKAWVDGTGSKIGSPIATNQVHRVSWNAKADWSAQTGDIQFEILCQDERTTNPVDLHFLTLPLADGNLTISRSPLTDSDFESYAKYLLSTGQADLNETSNEIELSTSTSQQSDFLFTSAGKIGKDGPNEEDINASYLGTSLEGNVSMTIQGVQEWTVHESGIYQIEAAGASGGWGKSGDLDYGYGAQILGIFELNASSVLNVVVGQQGEDGSGTFSGGGGGGGSFVWIKNSPSPLLVAGGGGGATGHSGPSGNNASTSENGTVSTGNPQYIGGSNGSYGTYKADSGDAGGGGSGWYFSGPDNKAGKKFNGANYNRDGGFGGGGGGNRGGGGGGGYSGGGGGHTYHHGGGGGGSYNASSTKLALINSNRNGFVRIRKIQPGTTIEPTSSNTLLRIDMKSSGFLRFIMLARMGYRIADNDEVSAAQAAATPGSINKWGANGQIKPREFPKNINEFGFDTGDHGHRAWWVVKD